MRAYTCFFCNMHMLYNKYIYIHIYIIQHIYSSYRIAQPFQGSQPDIRTKISKNNFNFQKQNTEYLNAELGTRQFVTFATAATRQCDNFRSQCLNKFSHKVSV